MHPRSRIIQLTCLALISLSGVLLGLSQGDWTVTITAVMGGLVGFILVDYLRLFYLTGWLANSASILILIFAIQDFYGGDSAVKLISVGRLLVYLQTVLMFQQKTPRLYWQVLVLSLLQVVVAAIFNLKFEGGLLFVVYFGLAGAMMMLQCDLTQWFDVERANTRNVKRARDRVKASRVGVKNESGAAPYMVFEQQVPISYWQLIQHLFPWLAVAFVFSIVLFYNVPRNETAWLGPGVRQVTGAGQSFDMNLDQRGVIPQSGRLIFRAWFRDPSGKEVDLAGRPYFRGLPLSRLVVENGVSDWRAPYDSVYQFSYTEPPSNDSRFENWLVQEFALEGTNDPLLFGTSPWFRVPDTPKEVEFCRDISALSRRRRGDHTELQVFSYTLGVKVDRRNQPLNSWPFVPEPTASPNRSLADDKGLRDALTHLEPERYPELVAEAKRIASRYAGTGTKNIAEQMSDFFNETNGFAYTLDFRSINRDRDLDPVEDFFRNHRLGHCQFYASALAIMLRSQNIPCRVVVGYRGSEFNSVNHCYMVREQHAHAWVEAYIPPDEVTQDMVRRGTAGRGGAWFIVDPTTQIFNDDTVIVAGQTLELARNLWQDYILGLDNEKQLEPMNLSSSILGMFDLSNWQAMGEQMATPLRSRPVLSGILVAIATGIFGLIVYRRLRYEKKIVRRKSQPSTSRFRQLVGGALYWISPELGTWVMGDVYQQQIVPFYEKMIAILQRNFQLTRQPNQTHRDFAQSVCSHFQSHPESTVIRDAVEQITEAFYMVRFGNRRLDNPDAERIERTFEILENHLKQSPAQMAGANKT